MRCALLLAAACGGSSPAPAPEPQPIANVAPAPPPPPTSTCIPPSAPIADARLVDGVLVACYVVPQPSGHADDCWRFDLATSAWSFATRKPHATVARRPPNVTATATSASACTLDGSDCKTIPLSGIKRSPDDELAGATNLDRSIVAVWAGTGPVHVFDASGKRLATIKPWPAGMRGKDPSWFREAHVLGSTIEVRIADTPISSAIRLYDARGNKIADVFGGKPMQDTAPPLELGGSRYAFITLDPRMIVITDVATGTQLGSYPIPGDVGSLDILMRTPDGNVAGVIGANAVMLDIAAGRLSSVAGPTCAPRHDEPGVRRRRDDADRHARLDRRPRGRRRRLASPRSSNIARKRLDTVPDTGHTVRSSQTIDRGWPHAGPIWLIFATWSDDDGSRYDQASD